MKNFFRKVSNIFISGVIACAGILPFWSVPVLADTTYYSYGQFLGSENGNTIYGIDLSISPVNFVVCNYNTGTDQRFNVAYYVYAITTTNVNDAQTALLNNLGISSFNELKGLRYSGTPGNFNYGSAVSWSNNYMFGTGYYVWYAYIGLDPNMTLFSCYARSGAMMVSTSNDNNIRYFVEEAIKEKEGIALKSGYSVGSFAGGWVKNSTAITPVYDMTGLGGTGDDGMEPEPTATPDSGDDEGGEDGSGSSSATQQQQQYQTIAEGAVAFTIEDGAFTQSQSQTIEENAVNVTVNNNNALTQENYQELNSLINNYNGSSEDETDPFQQAIGNFQAFHAIALAFAGLASIVFGWLPWWVTALLGAMFSMVCVFIVLRLIHLFK